MSCFKWLTWRLHLSWRWGCHPAHQHFAAASAARAVEWSRSRPVWGRRERGSAMVSLPVSTVSIFLCASSKNLIYLKIRMLSKWYKWLAFSAWIMWRRLLMSWQNAGFGGGCGERGVAQWHQPFPVPWHSHWGLWTEGYRRLLFSAWQLQPRMLPNGGFEWSFSRYIMSVNKKPGCSSLGRYTDPGVIWVLIFTLKPAWWGKKPEINPTYFILDLWTTKWHLMSWVICPVGCKRHPSSLASLKSLRAFRGRWGGRTGWESAWRKAGWLDKHSSPTMAQ